MKTVFTIFSKINQLLHSKQKSKIFFLFLLVAINSVLELFGLGAILPLLLSIIDENIIENYWWADWIYQNFNLKDERHVILILSFIVFLVFCLKNIISIWIKNFHSKFSFSLFKNLSLRLHKQIYLKGYLFFKSTNSNVIARDTLHATLSFSSNIFLNCFYIINELLILLSITIFLLFYDMRVFTILILTVLPFFLIFFRWARKKNVEINREQKIIQPLVMKNIFQSIFGYVDIVVNGSEKSFRNNIKENLNTLSKLKTRSAVYNLIPSKVIETSIILAVVILITSGLYFFDSKVELIELIGIFIIASYKIMPSINKISISINMLTQNNWVFDSLNPLFENSLSQSNQINKSFSFKKELKLDSISFKYPGQSDYVLEDFSLTIKKGEKIGLIGPSGSGKTTIMNILLQFIKPSKGLYSTDNIPMTNINTNSFYEKVGYVQQKVYLINASLAENIAFGQEMDQIDLIKINEVIDKSSLSDMVNEFPNGINTLIKENGSNLSGGQQQRIGIARALYFNSEILFFDEPTSSLDKKAKKHIMDTINKLNTEKLTIIIISHDFKTLNYCDRIINLAK